MSTNPVGSGPSLQNVAHAPSANTARVARPTGISPGYSQEITRGYLKGTADSSAPIATQIDALRNKLHISPDPRTDSLFRMAVSKLGVRLVGLKGDTAINDRMIDARVAQLEGQRAARNDSFARLKINHDIDQLKTLKELRGLINTGDRLAEERANLSFQMADLNRKLNDPKIPHAERLRVEQEYRSKAEQLDRISIRLKGVPEGMAAEANANVMDAILTKFGNPPKPVTADFLRQQLSDMQNAFAAYSESVGGAKNAEPLLQSMRRNLHDAFSGLCAKGLMNRYVNDSSANNVITRINNEIDHLGPSKAGPARA